MGITSRTVYDGFGRPIGELRTVPEGTLRVDREYDAAGRLHKVSFPYLEGGERHDTTHTYDTADRLRRRQTDDGSGMSMDYTNAATQVTDAVGAMTRRTLDALGRLEKVEELSVAPPLTTSYTYDVLDDLTKVEQSGQERTFAYDWLKRLVCASNPESRMEGASCLSSPLPGSGLDRYDYDATRTCPHTVTPARW